MRRAAARRCVRLLAVRAGPGRNRRRSGRAIDTPALVDCDPDHGPGHSNGGDPRRVGVPMNGRINRPLTAALLVALASPAIAQIGTGRALDRNLQRGSGGVNPRSNSYADELRFRNAVVTGNAPGGFSFRGDVGYRAAGEFSSRLGSDD